MFPLRILRRTALITAVVLGFVQGAVAAMGCAMMRTQDNLAVMPSGEPCAMMGETPAPLVGQHLLTDATGVIGESAATFPHLDAVSPVPVPVTVPAPLGIGAARESTRILGPPPFRLTRRLRI